MAQLYCSNSVFIAKTIQSSNIKTLFNALKDMITETSWVLKSSGIHNLNFNNSACVLAGTDLLFSGFDEFRCDYQQIIIGVNMLNLSLITNTVEDSDTVTIYIDKNDYHDGDVSYLGFVFENGKIQTCRHFKLKLSNVAYDPSNFPTVSYSSVITFPSAGFQKIIKDFNSYEAKKMEIKSVGRELIFSCKSSLLTTEIRRSEASDNSGISFASNNGTNVIDSGVFCLKSLASFVKCTPLCPQVEIHLQNNLPLVVVYKVGTLGVVKLCLKNEAL